MKFTSIDLLRVQVYSTTLPSIDNDRLMREILSTQNYIPGALQDGFGDVTNQTYFEDTTFPWGQPESTLLLSAVEDAVSEICGNDMDTSEAWVIRLLRGQSVMAHSHRVNNHLFPQEYFSVAYYANAPTGSANLIFEIGHSNLVEQITSISPEAGMLVIFNSYLKHMTTRHNSDEARFVISANLHRRHPSSAIVPDLSAYRIMSEHGN